MNPETTLPATFKEIEYFPDKHKSNHGLYA